jgi:deazaflavin-dependent oxidoreductase (nitroreductase family)
MKRHIVHVLQKYLFNPPVKLVFAIGLAMPGRALLETTGRKTGKARRIPVGIGLVGKQFWIVAEHGRNAAYVRNIESNPRVRVKLREGLGSRWHTGTATSFPTMIHASASAGSRRRSPEAPATPPPSASSALNC